MYEDPIQGIRSSSKGTYSKLSEQQNEARRAYGREYSRGQCALRDSTNGDTHGGAGQQVLLIYY